VRLLVQILPTHGAQARALAKIEETFPKGSTAGDRYADMSTIDG
jgi:hypothetical protein